MISESWRDVDPETKAYCKALANIDARDLLFRKHHVKTKSGTEQRTSSNQQFSKSVQAKLTYLSNVEDYSIVMLCNRWSSTSDLTWMWNKRCSFPLKQAIMVCLTIPFRDAGISNLSLFTAAVRNKMCSLPLNHAILV